mgnify:CR=1 FL=1
MYNVYLIIPVVMFKIQMKFDVRDEAVACVLSMIFNIISHAALYVNFAVLCGVGMWAIGELGLITFTVKQILLVALAVFSVYEIINTVITAGSRK